MSIKASILAATLGIAVLVPSFANAAESTPRIDTRQANQIERISKGLISGRLTFNEAINLLDGQAKVYRIERRALQDGHVSRKERRHIEQLQDRQAKKIRRNLRDNQRVAWNHRYWD